MWEMLVPGRTLQNYLIVVGLIALSLLTGLAVRLIWRFVFLPIARRTPAALNVLLLERTEKAVSKCAVISALYLAYLAGLDLLEVVPGKYERWTDGVFFVIAVLLGCSLAYEMARAGVEWYMRDFSRKGANNQMPAQFTPIIERVMKAAILGIGLIMLLGYFNVNVSGLLATAGIASLAVALAAQETVANVIAGFALMADRTFRPGDRLELPGGEVGDVVDVSLRTTRILTFDDTLLIVPNSELAKARIVNQSYPTAKLKVGHKLGVAYSSDMARVKQVLREIAAAEQGVCREPEPVIFFTGFGDSSLDILFVFWIADYREKLVILDRVNMEIDRRFREEKIEIPFPQRDIHISSTVERTDAGPKTKA